MAFDGPLYAIKTYTVLHNTYDSPNCANQGRVGIETLIASLMGTAAEPFYEFECDPVGYVVDVLEAGYYVGMNPAFA